jgi:hypothetical protein
MEQPESANPTAQKGSKRRAQYIRGGLRTESSRSWFISRRKLFYFQIIIDSIQGRQAKYLGKEVLHSPWKKGKNEDLLNEVKNEQAVEKPLIVTLNLALNQVQGLMISGSYKTLILLDAEINSA